MFTSASTTQKRSNQLDRVNNIHPILLNMLAKSTTLYKPSTREPLTIWQAIDNHILFVLAENYAWDSCSWPFLEYVCISLKKRALYKYI